MVMRSSSLIKLSINIEEDEATNILSGGAEKAQKATNGSPQRNLKTAKPWTPGKNNREWWQTPRRPALQERQVL
jgi:hypothetical protein